MCYNVLCDKYATRQLYGYCPSWALNWEYRKKAIMQEILSCNADIISLQVRNCFLYTIVLKRLNLLNTSNIFQCLRHNRSLCGMLLCLYCCNSSNYSNVFLIRQFEWKGKRKGWLWKVYTCLFTLSNERLMLVLPDWLLLCCNSLAFPSVGRMGYVAAVDVPNEQMQWKQSQTFSARDYMGLAAGSTN